MKVGSTMEKLCLGESSRRDDSRGRTPVIAHAALSLIVLLGCGSAQLKTSPDAGSDGPAGGTSGGSAGGGRGGGSGGGQAGGGQGGGSGAAAGTAGSAAGSGGAANGGGAAGSGGAAGTGGTSPPTCSPACDSDHVCVGTKCLLNDGLACTLASQCASNACTLYYHDGDGDGYGAGTPSNFCGTATLVGYATQGGDCCDDNATINPGADFHTTIGSCDGVTTWDYNCDGTAEPQKTGSISVPNGCVSGAACPSCTANPMTSQLVVQTCGAWTTGTVCINAACSTPQVAQCMAATADVYQQACR